MDEVLVILVIVFILIEEDLSKQAVDDAWEVALGFFGNRSEVIEFHRLIRVAWDVLRVAW